MRIGIAEQLTSAFGGSVGRHWRTDVIVLSKGHALPGSINGRRRAKEELPDVVRAATFQEVERTLDVHFTVGERSFDRGTHPSHSGEMDDQIDRLLLEEPLQQRMVPDVALPAYHAS